MPDPNKNEAGLQRYTLTKNVYKNDKKWRNIKNEANLWSLSNIKSKINEAQI